MKNTIRSSVYPARINIAGFSSACVRESCVREGRREDLFDNEPPGLVVRKFSMGPVGDLGEKAVGNVMIMLGARLGVGESRAVVVAAEKDKERGWM